ncbi:RNA polymerase sigma factor [bacterium]|nr:RNA polymerase sigma factor [bacterium]
MPTGPVSGVLDHLRRAALRAGPGDGELLGRFVDHRDAEALAALVGRHGPMVWGVCRRALGHHDAEDAVQATFLVLVRKAAAVVPREAVGNWLYGVAHRTALLARRTAARRRTREVQVPTLPDPAAPPDPAFDAALLDAELSRLPDIYRGVLVLCELEGRTRAEAARTLGVPEGTVAGRLVRARALLAKRLAARGVAPAAVVAALAPAAVARSTIDAATRVAAGQAAIPEPVAALTAGVTKAMLFTKLRAATAVVLMCGLAAVTTTLAGRPAAGQDGAQPAATKTADPPTKQKKDEEVVAWGRRVGGLQAGLVVRGGQKAVYRHGDTITLGVRVRNVGKEAVTFGYVRQHLDENPPTVTDPDGATIPQPRIGVTGVAHPATKVTLEPGKEIELESRFFGAAGRRYELLPEKAPAADRESPERPLFVGTGLVTVEFERVFGDSSIGKAEVAPALRRLGTGAVEIEVEPAAPREE